MFEKYIKERLDDIERKEDEILVKDEFFYSKDFDLNSDIFNQKISYPKIKKLIVHDIQTENIEFFFKGLFFIAPNIEEIELNHFNQSGIDDEVDIEHDFDRDRMIISDDINQFFRLKKISLDFFSYRSPGIIDIVKELNTEELLLDESLNFENENELQNLNKLKKINSIFVKEVKNTQLFFKTIESFDIKQIVLGKINKNINKEQSNVFKELNKDYPILQSLEVFAVSLDTENSYFDFNILRKFKNLKELGIDINYNSEEAEPIDLKPLEGIKKLTDLSITGYSEKKFSFNCTLKLLEKITLGNIFNELDNLEYSKGLSQLSIKGKLKNYNFLKDYTKLEEVSITESNFNDLFLLEKNENLKKLRIVNLNNEISTNINLQSVDKFNQLEVLDIEMTKADISNLKSLEKLNNLHTIALSQISSLPEDLSPLMKINRLGVLDLSNIDSPIDLSTLGKLNHIHKITLSDLKKLKGLDSLKEKNNLSETKPIINIARCYVINKNSLTNSEHYGELMTLNWNYKGEVKSGKPHGEGGKDFKEIIESKLKNNLEISDDEFLSFFHNAKAKKYFLDLIRVFENGKYIEGSLNGNTEIYLKNKNVILNNTDELDVNVSIFHCNFINGYPNGKALFYNYENRGTVDVIEFKENVFNIIGTYKDNDPSIFEIKFQLNIKII